MKNEKLSPNVVTFFFCLPPPDWAGFDDNGGALSFFGAYNYKYMHAQKKLKLDLEKKNLTFKMQNKKMKLFHCVP